MITIERLWSYPGCTRQAHGLNTLRLYHKKIRFVCTSTITCPHSFVMKRVRRRLSVHTSSLDQHHEMKKHNVLPTLRNCKEEIKNHFDAVSVEVSTLKDEDLTEIVADNSQSVEDYGIIDLNAGIDTSEIQHDLKTTPEIRSSHSVRKILAAVSKLKFFKRLKCKETLQQLAAKGTYLRLPKKFYSLCSR